MMYGVVLVFLSWFICMWKSTYFVYFVHYFLSAVMLDVTLSLGSNLFSLVMGYSVCDQCPVGTSVSVASLLSDVSMGVSFWSPPGRVIMYDCLWQHVHVCVCCMLPFTHRHTKIWLSDTGLVVPGRVRQGMHGYVGGSSEVNWDKRSQVGDWGSFVMGWWKGTGFNTTVPSSVPRSVPDRVNGIASYLNCISLSTSVKWG